MVDSSQITHSDIILGRSSSVARHPLEESRDILNASNQGSLSDRLRSGTFLTSTTTAGTTATLNYIADIAISAFMRTNSIDFFSYNLRPNRRVYPFFDEKDVTGIIQKPNIIELDNDSTFLSLYPQSTRNLSNVVQNIRGTSGPAVGDANPLEVSGSIDTSQEIIRIGSSTGPSARVLFTEKSTSGKTILYVSDFVKDNENFVIAAGNTVYGMKSGSTAKITSYQHFSGHCSTTLSGAENIFTVNTVGPTSPIPAAGSINSQVVLSFDASDVNEYYTGNTIAFVTGPSEEVTEIVAYDGATRTATISPTVNNVLPGVIYSIGDRRSPYVSNTAALSHYTTPKGFFGGILHIPGPVARPRLGFRTGSKLFKITDDPTNKTESATTVSEYYFNAYTIDISKGQVTINNPSGGLVVSPSPSGTVSPVSQSAGAITPPIIPNNPIIDTLNQTTTTRYLSGKNPIAQSFFISDTDYPRGIYVPYVDLFFANKGTLPIELQIRPVVNGFPDSRNVVPNAVAIVEAEDVRTSQVPNSSDPDTYTRFTFNSPVYLFPGQEYALVLSSNDYDYDVYISELGETIIGTNRLVSQQPYLGSLFRSQNSSTYDALQSEDMMFVIHKCEFVSTGHVIFHEEKKSPENLLSDFNLPTIPYSNTMVDTFVINSDAIELPGTSLTYQFKSTTLGNTSLDSSYVIAQPARRMALRERKVIYDKYLMDQESFLMKVDLNTTSKDVSPIVYKNRQLLSTGEVLINNMEMNSMTISIANTGNTYTAQNTAVIITSNVGSGANATIVTAVEEFATGKLGTLAFDGVGSGYYEDVNIDIVSSDGTDAEVVAASETSIAGGPAAARYVSKTITLASEFEAGDLRVFLTAVKPQESDIQVYYKVRNKYDSQLIDEKRWSRMAPVTGVVNYSINHNPIELEYRPSLTSNTIIYSSENGTFDTFSQFKVKIVLASSSTTLDKIPFVIDLRAIALPGDE